MIADLYWLGHASFRLELGSVIYLDPWKLTHPKPADLILITHGHRDHLSPDDVARISQPGTVLVCPPSCADKLHGNVRTMQPGDHMQVGAVAIEAVPSYNTNKPNHPQSAGNLGYIVEAQGKRFYHAGDTDLIPEMVDIRCDVALLPMGGTYTMNAEEAAQAAGRLVTRMVVPMHWGDIVGTQADVERLRQLMPSGIELIVLKPEA
jgi:L-ascorbate metabolism protein UlaG (beta-lactamase superfamily)